jgi:hypothetical protein
MLTSERIAFGKTLRPPFASTLWLQNQLESQFIASGT